MRRGKLQGGKVEDEEGDWEPEGGDDEPGGLGEGLHQIR
jgi:hypothetical protein